MAKHITVFYLLAAVFLLFAVASATGAMAQQEEAGVEKEKPALAPAPIKKKAASAYDEVTTATKKKVVAAAPTTTTTTTVAPAAAEDDNKEKEVKLEDIGRQSAVSFAKARKAATGIAKAPRSLLQVCRKEITKQCRFAGYERGVAVANRTAAEKAAEKAESERLASSDAAAAAAAVGLGKRGTTAAGLKKKKPSEQISSVVKCLTEKKDEIEDQECRSWIDSRELCMTAAKSVASCNMTVDSLRVCLRKAKDGELPTSCTSTPFYKSVKMFGMFREGKNGTGRRIEGGERRARPTRAERSYNDKTRKPRPTAPAVEKDE